MCVCVCACLCEQERERERAFTSPEHFSGVSFACLHLMSSLKDNLLGHPAWDRKIPECLSSISPPRWNSLSHLSMQLGLVPHQPSGMGLQPRPDQPEHSSPLATVIGS